MTHPLVTPCEGCHWGFEKTGLSLISCGGLSLEPEDSPYSQIQTINTLKPSFPFPTSSSASPAISSTRNAVLSTYQSFIYSLNKNPLISFISPASVKQI